MHLFSEEKGIYTIEAVLCISVFSILYMSLLSFVILCHTESQTQYALDKAALEIAKYCYFCDEDEDFSPEFCRNIFLSYFKNSIKAKESFSEGIDFTESDLFSDGESVTLKIIYDYKILGVMRFSIRQTAKSRAWIEKSESIWQKNNFIRGKEFVRIVKDENPEAAVESGVGLDLYFDDKKSVYEIHSMNIFSDSYKDSISTEEQLMKYAGDLTSDLKRAGETIKIENGKTKTLSYSRKVLYIIVPEEAKTDSDAAQKLSTAAANVSSKTDIEIVFDYREKAL